MKKKTIYDVKEMVNKAGLCDRPEYYSGRGPMTCDLNSEQLEKIYSLIKKNIGDDAAQNYVGMVATLNDMSATSFLNNLYNLFYADWKWDCKKPQANGIDFSNEVEAFGTLAGVMSRRNDTDDDNRWANREIRMGFLQDHQLECEKAQVPEDCRLYCECDMFGNGYYTTKEAETGKRVRRTKQR